MLADTRENVTISKALTLDLNGFTLNGSTGERKAALKVDNATVTVKDSSANQTGTIKREDVEDPNVTGSNSYYVIDIQGGNGLLIFEGGNVTNTSGIVGVKGASLVRLGDDAVSARPTLTINGGTFTQDNFAAIKVDRGTLHFKGGTVNGNVASVNYDSAPGKQARIFITGGYVTGTLGTYTYNNGLVPTKETAMATVEVTGGTFDKDPMPYVVEGSTVKKNADGTFGVEKAYLAKVGDKSYYTMDEAFKAQTASGEAIVLLRDYTTGSTFNSGSINRTVDLNGHTWTYTGTATNRAAFEINYPNVTLTVMNGKVVSNSMVGLIPSADGGKTTYDNSGLVFDNVQATANGNSGIETNGNNTNDTVTLKNSTLNVPNGFGIYFPSSGKLTIENSQITAKTLGVQVCSGSLDISGAETKIEVTGDPVPKTENDGAIQDGAAISIVNRAGYKGLGTITVTEGTFKAKSGNAAVKAYDWKDKTESNFTEPGKVEISGGSYSSEVDAALCKNGFECTKTGSVYTVIPATDDAVAVIGSVTYSTLDAALATAKNGDKVVVIKDTETTNIIVPIGVRLDLNGHTVTASTVFSLGDVRDTQKGAGKLIVAKSAVTFQASTSYMPLYDVDGYRFFQYRFGTNKVTANADKTEVYNEIYLTFWDDEAYQILRRNAGEGHGLKLGLDVTWDAAKANNQNWYIDLPADVLAKLLDDLYTNNKNPINQVFTLTIVGVDSLGEQTMYIRGSITSTTWAGRIINYGQEFQVDLKK